MKVLFNKIDWFEGNKMNDNIDVKLWQEEWEDEEINDQFENVLRNEIKAFKQQN